MDIMISRILQPPPPISVWMMVNLETDQLVDCSVDHRYNHLTVPVIIRVDTSIEWRECG
ncbi:hypothetical protein BDB01DRAFT_814435 [Pilobolus umbonatus]|nr:hypothetical protein BDB01DRAFT_814435 [Pilobolus umbonatus]